MWLALSKGELERGRDVEAGRVEHGQGGPILLINQQRDLGACHDQTIDAAST